MTNQAQHPTTDSLTIAERVALMLERTRPTTALGVLRELSQDPLRGEDVPQDPKTFREAMSYAAKMAVRAEQKSPPNSLAFMFPDSTVLSVGLIVDGMAFHLSLDIGLWSDTPGGALDGDERQALKAAILQRDIFKEPTLDVQ